MSSIGGRTPDRQRVLLCCIWNRMYQASNRMTSVSTTSWRRVRAAWTGDRCGLSRLTNLVQLSSCGTCRCRCFVQPLCFSTSVCCQVLSSLPRRLDCRCKQYTGPRPIYCLRLTATATDVPQQLTEAASACILQFCQTSHHPVPLSCVHATRSIHTAELI